MCCDRVGREEVDDFVRSEAGVAHAREDLVVRVGRLRDEEIGRRLGGVRAASEEREAGATSTV